MAEQVYRPSQTVPVSGVYRVEHDGHREAHDATLRVGEIFPPCANCQDRVRFSLKQQADVIKRDKDFVSPS